MIPEGFAAEMQELLGADEAGRLVAALQTEPVVGVRLNPLKPCELPAALEGERVPWCPEGRYLQGRPQFTLMPQLHAGGFYVQDPSSMIVAEVVRRLAAEIGRPMTALDACAAPGGKTTALLSALPEGSRLVANEFDPRRAQILVENMVKWGAPNLIVTQGDTARLRGLRQTFDLVLVDAPCSGEGMMRKDPAAREQWSQGLVRSCAVMQEEILDNIWPTLKPGGYLIYSTCTFNRLEDENQALRLISGEGAESMNLNMPAEWGIGASREQDLHALRFMPHITRGEGLFLTVLRKPGHLTEKPAKKADKKAKKQKKTIVPARLKTWLKEPESFEYLRSSEGEWSALPAAMMPLLGALDKDARVISAGVRLAAEKGRDLISAHPLALSTALSADAFPRVELSEAQALDYLRREALQLPADAPRGYLLVTFAGLPLGFIKNLGNRSNNLYPAPYRIRHL